VTEVTITVVVVRDVAENSAEIRSDEFWDVLTQVWREGLAPFVDHVVVDQ
jgi:hypothetical protein